MEPRMEPERLCLSMRSKNAKSAVLAMTLRAVKIRLVERMMAGVIGAAILRAIMPPCSQKGNFLNPTNWQ